MSKRTKIAVAVAVGIVAIGALVVTAGPAIYRDFLAPPPAETPLLTADDSTLSMGNGAPLEATALDGTWTLSARSVAGYRVDEVLNGTDVTVTGRTSEVEGTLTISELTLTEAEFTVDVGSISTDSPQRDSYFRDTALRTAEHPTATFRLTEPVVAPTTPRVGETVEQQLVGELSIAGVTQPVTFTAQVRTDGTTAEIAGQIPITFSDFGVQAPSLGFVSVENDGFVEFELVARRG
ncbi:YceI family protein [Leucobacter sp. W1153]|uniref:YceI family protein n=1 Tax=Leucobacter sp. W1153 TaxID=3439064 RepID=UPI003F2CD14F